jgi:hypothetical protein
VYAFQVDVEDSGALGMALLGQLMSAAAAVIWLLLLLALVRAPCCSAAAALPAAVATNCCCCCCCCCCCNSRPSSVGCELSDVQQAWLRWSALRAECI